MQATWPLDSRRCGEGAWQCRCWLGGAARMLLHHHVLTGRHTKEAELVTSSCRGPALAVQDRPLKLSSGASRSVVVGVTGARLAHGS